jgi:hypothetical protein
MEYWNTGFVGTRSILIFDTAIRVKSDHSPLLDIIIPFFHYSNIPLVTGQWIQHL